MPEKAAIGTVTMNPDRTITLELKATDGSGLLGQAMFVLRPGEEGYDETLRRLNGLSPGQTKLLYE